MHFARSAVRALIAATTLSGLAAAPAGAQQVDRIIAFGDSLADTGNALHLLLNSPAVPPATKAQLQALYPTGRFSGGTNYIDSLSEILDAPVLNYAVGGAQTGPFNQFPGLPGFSVETGIFLSGATPPGTIFPPNDGFQEGDLLALSVGINDARAFYQANPGATIAQAQAAALVSVANATTNLNLLVGAGPPTISYVALNAGLTPDVLPFPALAALGNAYSTTFNAGFQNTLAGYAADGVIVHYLDGPVVLANIAANPGAYGISSLFCPAAPNPTCILNASGYLFYADGIHPTSDGMRIIARYVATQLAGPLTLQAPADIGVDTAHQFGRTLQSRLGNTGFGEPRQGLRLFAVGDAWSSKHRESRGNDTFDNSAFGITGGLEYGFGAGSAGVAINYSRPEADFANDAAKVKSDSVQLGAFAGMGFGAGGFAKVHIGYGWDDHDIERRGVVEGMEASPKGHHWLAGARAGYLMPMAGLNIGPVAALDYAKAKVKGYVEDGDPALTLDVGSQNYKSLRGGLGLEVRADLGEEENLRPYLSAMVEKEWSGNSRSIQFAQTSAPVIVNTFEFESPSKRAYGRFNLGGTTTLSSAITLDAGVSLTVGRKYGNETSGQLALNVGF
jgi:outer membrane lipase/esterase